MTEADLTNEDMAGSLPAIFVWGGGWMDQILIAVGQMVVAQDIAANGAAIREQMREAGRAGARLIQFPECALCGSVKTHILDWALVDWALIRRALVQIAELAGELSIWVVVGSAHRLTGSHLPHNSLYVIDDHGQLHGRYDKRWTSNSELQGWFTPGRTPLVFEVDGFRFGCAICIEVCFPEVFIEYEGLGADCCLLSSYSNDASHGVMAQGQAGLNCLWASLAVPAQCAADLPSCVIGPDSGVLARVGRVASAQVLVAQLDKTAPDYAIALTKARPWRRLARVGEIYRVQIVDDPRSTDRISW